MRHWLKTFLFGHSKITPIPAESRILRLIGSGEDIPLSGHSHESRSLCIQARCFGAFGLLSKHRAQFSPDFTCLTVSSVAVWRNPLCGASHAGGDADLSYRVDRAAGLSTRRLSAAGFRKRLYRLAKWPSVSSSIIAATRGKLSSYAEFTDSFARSVSSWRVAAARCPDHAESKKNPFTRLVGQRI